MGTFSAIIIEEQPRKKVCLSFLLYAFGLMASCVSQKLNVKKLLYTEIKVRVDPFFRDLVQFTILLPLKDLSSVHNPYLLAMKNMITILFFKAEN